MHCSLSHACHPHLILSAAFLAVFLPLLLAAEFLPLLLQNCPYCRDRCDWVNHRTAGSRRGHLARPPSGHHPMHCTAAFVLHCAVLQCTAPCCTALCSSAPLRTVMHSTALHCVVHSYTAFHRTALCFTTLHCGQVEISLSQHWGTVQVP